MDRTEKDKNAKLTNEFVKNGFSFNTLASLSQKNEGRFSSSSMEFFVILKIFEKTVLEVERKIYEIPANKLVFIGPEKHVRFVEYNVEKIFVITFSSHFYEKSAKDAFLLNSNLFFDSSEAIHIANTLTNSVDFKRFIIDRLEIYAEKNTDLYLPFAHNCIERLILEGLLHTQTSNKTNHKDFSLLKLVNQFKVELHKKITSEKTVQYYADYLNVTSRKLSESCETILGKKAKQVILEKIVQETIRLVQNTNFTVSEIAYKLGFNDEANFNKLIKKHTGKNPTQLKK